MDDPGPATRAVRAEVEALQALLAGASPLVARVAAHHLDAIVGEVALLEVNADRLAAELHDALQD